MSTLSTQKLLIVSDLHLSDGGPQDSFRKNEKYFCGLLDLAKERNYKVIVLGDLFDMWSCGDFGNIIQRYSNLLNKLVLLKPILILGNHDALFESISLKYNIFKGMQIIPRQLILGRTLFIHGHQFDPTVNFFSNLVRFARIKAERRFPLAKKFNDIWIKAISMSYHKSGLGRPKEYYRAKATDYASKFPEIKRIVIGHQHQPDHFVTKIKNRKIEYYNSGCWLDGQRDYLLLDPL